MLEHPFRTSLPMDIIIISNIKFVAFQFFNVSKIRDLNNGFSFFLLVQGECTSNKHHSLNYAARFYNQDYFSLTCQNYITCLLRFA
jgi:hypothetical protein